MIAAVNFAGLVVILAGTLRQWQALKGRRQGSWVNCR